MTDRQRKPYRWMGLPVSHGDLYIEHLKPTYHGHIPERVIDDDPMATCEGLMVHYGDAATTRTGDRYVEWDGDVWHHEITCELCGWRTTVPTQYKLEYQIEHPPKGKHKEANHDQEAF